SSFDTCYFPDRNYIEYSNSFDDVPDYGVFSCRIRVPSIRINGCGGSSSIICIYVSSCYTPERSCALVQLFTYSGFCYRAICVSLCAFMLPVATPSNVYVFGFGYLRIPDMAKARFALHIIGIFLVTLTIYYLLPLVWSIDLSVIPDTFK